MRTVTTFSNLINTNLPPLAPLKKCLGLWNSSWLHNDMRNFLYLLRNNGIMLNNRLNAFDDTVSPNCTFCRIVDRDAAPRDGFLHFFFDCPVTFRLMSQWCSIFEPPLNINNQDFRNIYWYGCTAEEPDGSVPLTFVVDTFKYVLWKFIRRKKIPNFPAFRDELEFTITTAASLSKKLRYGITNNSMLTNFLQAQGQYSKLLDLLVPVLDTN